ncbi:unnamed protein product [Gongylonema pulchrum]|uniref:Proline rich 14 n=1 Tax=Gongylonema pulchrum TaxID=637853 RepID=A0A183D7X5_9BILA|nr:unnamed protein product [Gongylonema pulchrum]
MNPERRRKMPRPSAKRKDQVAPKAPEGLETGAQQVERVQTQAVIHPLPSQRIARVQDSPPLGSVMGSGSRTLLPAYVRSLLRTQESAVLSASVPSSSEVRRSEITPFSARSIEPPFIDTLETLRREVEDLQISPESSIHAPSGSGIRETGTIPAANLSSWEMQESNIPARIQELFRGQEEIDKKLSDLLGSWNSSDGMPSGRRARRRRELSVEASSGLRTRRMETLPLDAQPRAGKRKLGTIPVLLKIPRSSMQGMGMSVDALSSSGLGISRILPSSAGMLPDSEVRQPELLSLPRTFVDSQTPWLHCGPRNPVESQYRTCADKHKY